MMSVKHFGNLPAPPACPLELRAEDTVSIVLQKETKFNDKIGEHGW